jgi:hypothetical protein
MNKQLAFFLMIIVLGFSHQAKADWPVGKHRWILTPSYTYSQSTKFFNADRQLENSPFNGKFSSHTMSLYGVVGIGRKTDLVFNVPFASVTSQNILDKFTHAGVGDTYVGFSFHTPSKDLKKYFTLKVGAIIPLYSNTTEPYLGLGSKGFFVGSNYSFNVKKKTFAIIEGMFTRYFDQQDGPNKLNVNLVYGMELPKSNLLIFTLNHENSYSADKTFTANLNGNKDFMFGSAGVTYGKKISRTLMPTVKAFYTIYGRNAGQGVGIAVSMAIKIP